jgi:hypothetical protein
MMIWNMIYEQGMGQQKDTTAHWEIQGVTIAG